MNICMKNDQKIEQPKSVLITDLDDTLWDWLGIWHASFKPMLDEIIIALDEPEHEIIAAIKSIHQRVGTSEYFFLPQDLETHFGRPNDFNSIKLKYGKALEASKKGMKAELKLFPSVLETLHKLKETGTYLVGYTESMAYASIQRLRELGLDGVFDVLYSLEDHNHPEGLVLSEVRSKDASNYSLNITEHRQLPVHEVKPNPKVLTEIVARIYSTPENCVYIGDKLIKDVSMAQDAGILDIHAKYGEAKSRFEYNLLKQVTHWKPDDVEKEKLTTEKEITPSISLNNEFGEITNFIEFRRYEMVTKNG